MFKFIYPGNFKEAKTFLFFKIYDLVTAGTLTCFSIIYAMQNYSFIPLIFPAVFIILKIRLLEDGSNMWEKLLDVFNYLVNSQQLYFWGIRGKNDKNQK